MKIQHIKPSRLRGKGLVNDLQDQQDRTLTKSISTNNPHAVTLANEESGLLLIAKTVSDKKSHPRLGFWINMNLGLFPAWRMNGESKQHTAACCSENKNHYICLTEKSKVILPDTQSATLSLSTDNYLTKVSKEDCVIFGPHFDTFNRNLLISCQLRSRFLLPH